MKFENTLRFAKDLDNHDALKKYRDHFHFPQVNGKDVIYFTGNSLGLQPKKANEFVDEIMQDWRELAVEGHFYAEKPWWDYHERLTKPLTKIVGAKENEVSVMNTLTANLHFLMVSFYQTYKEKV